MPDAEEMREALVSELRERGTITSARVEVAMRTVPRHLFLPEADLADAYAISQVVTKMDRGGKAMSSVSHPGVIAQMLERLDPQRGHRVLEIGSGGYNAALLAHLVGPDGRVTTLDIDPDITDRARKSLSDAGYDQVEVITADGEYGHPLGAPYDRTVVTVGAWDLPPAWFDQLDPAHGRLVVPLRMRSLSRIVTLVHDSGIWRSHAIDFAGFVPVQGEGAHADQDVPLTQDGQVRLQTDQLADEAALTRVLEGRATEVWTGVVMPYGTSYEHLDLWLAGISGFSRLAATPEAIERGVVAPTFRWGGSAVHQGGSIAYLTERPVSGRPKAAEIGVRAHGPIRRRLADEIAERICAYDPDRRAVIEVRPHDDKTVPEDGFIIHKRHQRLILTWR